MALRRPAPRTRRAAASRRPRGPHGEPGRGESTRSSRSRSTVGDRRRPRRGRRLLRRAAAVARRRRLAWLEWDHPNMPWDATRLRVAAIERGRHARPSRSWRRGGPRRVDRQPAGRPTASLHFVSDRTGWWNLYRLRRRAEARAAGADGGRVRRPGLGLRPIVVRVPAPTARSSRSAGPTAATGCSGSSPGRLAGEVEPPFTELDAPPGRRAHRSSRIAGARRRSIGRRPLRPGHARPAGVLRRASTRRARPGQHLRRPSRSTSRRPAAAPPTASSTRRPTPSFVGPDGEPPPLVVLVARRPDRARVDRARPRPSSSSPAAASPSSTSTTAAAPATAATTASARRAVGGRRRRRLRRGGRSSSPSAATSIRDRIAIRGRQRQRLHDARRARVPRRVRGRHQPLRRSATSSFSSSETHKFESRYDDRLVGPLPGGRGALPRALADPLRRPTSRARCSSSRASTTGSCRRPRRSRSSTPWPRTACRTRTSRSRARTTGSAGADAIRRTLEAELVVPRPGLRLRAGRRDRAARAARPRRAGAAAHPRTSAAASPAGMTEAPRAR